MRLPQALATLLALALPAAAQVTWTVGGPNGQFATIQEALAVAGPDDLVDVQPGTYPGFTMSSPARVMGRNGVQVNGLSRMVGLPPGSTALVADLSVDAFQAIDCEGSTLVDGIFTRSFEARGCSDLRVRELEATANWLTSTPAAVVIDDSRVQLEASTILGESSSSADGGPGLIATGGSFLHLMDSRVEGGRGGAEFDLFTIYAPDGGDGMTLEGASAVRIVRSEVIGGGGGWHNYAGGGFNCYDGFHGPGLRQCGGHSQTWDSEIRDGYWSGSFTSPGPPFVMSCGATLTSGTDLPGLTLTGPLTAGSNFDLAASAGVGTSLRLVFGRRTDLDLTLGTQIPRLVEPLRIASLGSVPATGEAHVQGTVPTWPRGTQFFLQVSRTGATGTDFSNSTLFLVR